MADPRAASWHLPLRFGIVGVLNTAFGYVVFAALMLAGVPSAVALILSTVISIAFNFQTSRRLVFRANSHWVRFLLVYAVVLAIDWTILRLAHTHGISELTAQLVLALPLAALSFFGQRLFVFDASAGEPEL